MKNNRQITPNFDLDDIMGRSKKDAFVRTTVRLPEKLRNEAVKHGINISKVTRQALSIVLDKIKKAS